MSIGILLVTHEGLGPALKAAARQILGAPLPMTVETLEVPPDADLAQLRAQADALLAGMDAPQTLVLTDLYGSSPANVALAAAEGPGVPVLTGVNLPMLLRVLNYAERSLTDLVDTALEGGLRSIFLAKTAIR
jgi:PTS system ascorbate-specific IIA component